MEIFLGNSPASGALARASLKRQIVRRCSRILPAFFRFSAAGLLPLTSCHSRLPTSATPNVTNRDGIFASRLDRAGTRCRPALVLRVFMPETGTRDVGDVRRTRLHGGRLFLSDLVPGGGFHHELAG